MVYKKVLWPFCLSCLPSSDSVTGSIKLSRDFENTSSWAEFRFMRVALFYCIVIIILVEKEIYFTLRLCSNGSVWARSICDCFTAYTYVVSSSSSSSSFFGGGVGLGVVPNLFLVQIWHLPWFCSWNAQVRKIGFCENQCLVDLNVRWTENWNTSVCNRKPLTGIILTLQYFAKSHLIVNLKVTDSMLCFCNC